MKAIAIINVIAWAGFWAFGFLALNGQGYSTAELMTAAMLAAAGLITGLLTYLRLSRGAEGSGYAQKTNQLDAAARAKAQAEWGQ
jgi:predicted RND superfamily exporter protein